MDPVKMVLRLIAMVQAVTTEVLVPASSPKAVMKQLPDVLASLSRHARRCGRRWLLVLDGLDKTIEQTRFEWVPRSSPEGIRILVTCAAGKTSKQLLSDYWVDDGEGYFQRMAPDWIRLNVEPLDRAERHTFIARYLGKFRKSLPDKLVDRILTHPLSGRPIWLVTLLEEIRVFGIHEKLEQRIGILLSNPTSKAAGETPEVNDVFEHVLVRLASEKDAAKSATAFKALWAESDGMTESALLDFSGLSSSAWAAIRNSLDENLIETMGKIRIGTSFLSEAVANLWLPTMDCRRNIHLEMGTWYRKQEPSFTNLLCVVRHLSKSGSSQLIQDYMFSTGFGKLLPLDVEGLMCFDQGFRASGMAIGDFLNQASVAWGNGASDNSILCGKLEFLRRAMAVLDEVDKSFSETRQKIIEIEKGEGKPSKSNRIRKLEGFIKLPSEENQERKMETSDCHADGQEDLEGISGLQQLIDENLCEGDVPDPKE